MHHSVDVTCFIYRFSQFVHEVAERNKPKTVKRLSLPMNTSFPKVHVKDGRGQPKSGVPKVFAVGLRNMHESQFSSQKTV